MSGRSTRDSVSPTASVSTVFTQTRTTSHAANASVAAAATNGTSNAPSTLLCTRSPSRLMASTWAGRATTDTG